MHGDERQTLDPTWDLKVTPDHFAGIEISWWPAKIAETAMFLTEHMVTQRLAELGEPPSILPITHSARIVHDNALHIDWETVVPAGDHTLVFGNPPFVGARVMGSTQKAELKRAWGDVPFADLDYVTAWYARAMHFLAHTAQAKFAFVSTNSIAQGVSATALFEPIFNRGWHIAFAHQTFAWTSEAAGGAAVHCVVVGLARQSASAGLFTYRDPSSEASAAVVPTINGYLVAAPIVFVRPRTTPMAPGLPAVTFGSMPNDGGALLVAPEELREVLDDPVAARFVRRFVGAQELIHGEDRWCLWLTDAKPSELRSSPVLLARLERSKSHRASSTRASTRELAEVPWRFGEVRQPAVDYVCIPRHVSESRRYFTVARFESEVVCGDSNFLAADEDGLIFGVLSSAAFVAWLRSVGGKLESRLRFSGTLVWNNFPLPQLADARRGEIAEAGRAIAIARTHFDGQSLADLYDALTMPRALVDAHSELDRAVDGALGFRKKPTDDQRLTRLFDLYAEMTAVTG